VEFLISLGRLSVAHAFSSLTLPLPQQQEHLIAEFHGFYLGL